MGCELFFRHSEQLDAGSLADWLARRPNYEVGEDFARYHNPDTGVAFEFDFDSSSEFAAVFNLSYVGPTVRALEAAEELDALCQRFQPVVHDPQIDGMGDGPFSKEGFLRGWSAGNSAAISSLGVSAPRLEANRLREIWEWNFDRENLQARLGDQIFVPIIQLAPDGRGSVRTTVVWTDAIPVVLPEVDFVTIYREPGVPGASGDVIPLRWEEILPILHEHFRPETLRRPVWRVDQPSDVLQREVAQLEKSFSSLLNHGLVDVADVLECRRSPTPG